MTVEVKKTITEHHVVTSEKLDNFHTVQSVLEFADELRDLVESGIFALDDVVVPVHSTTYGRPDHGKYWLTAGVTYINGERSLQNPIR